MRAHQHGGRSARAAEAHSAIPRAVGKQSLVDASQPAHRVIQRQQGPGAASSGLDPEAVRAELTRIRDAIESVRAAVDPDGAGGHGVDLPRAATHQLRDLQGELDSLRLAIDGGSDAGIRDALRFELQGVQDALLAAFQTLAVYHADQTLQRWGNASEESRSAQRAQYHAEAGGLGADADWCGMFVNAQYRDAGLHGALNMAFNSTFHTEQFFTYGAGSANSPQLIQPHGEDQRIPVQAYHADRGALRSWRVGADIGDDIRPGDVVTLNWHGTSGVVDHVCIVRSYTPQRDDRPGELITIDGNAFGARKPGTSSPNWPDLGKDDMTTFGDARTNDVSTSRYETGLGGTNRSSNAGGPKFHRDAMLEGDGRGERAMIIHGRGRPSLVDFEPHHSYFNTERGEPFRDAGCPQGPIQRAA
jgi:hypothetical protein